MTAVRNVAFFRGRGRRAERLFRRVVSQLLPPSGAPPIEVHVADRDTVELGIVGLGQDIEASGHQRDVAVHLDVERVNAPLAIA